MAERRFRKNDRVRFRLGIRDVRGIVKEDRGPIGVKGRRLYLVEFRHGQDALSPSLVELPAEEMEPVRATASKR
jgi:hypothetical protein